MLVLPSDNFGCGRFRSVWPHKFINEHYGDIFDIDILFELPKDKTLEEVFSKYDIIHVHKQLDKNCQVIDMLKFLGKKVIVDVDDNPSLGSSHPMSLTAKKERWAEPIYNHLKKADMVSTTTPLFAAECRKYNKNVRVFPNTIDPTAEQFIPKPTESKRMRFGLICGSSHLKDIELMEGMTAMLPQEIKDKMQIVLCGFDTNGTRTIYHQDTGEVERRQIEPEESVWCDYEKIVTDNYSIVDADQEAFLKKYIPQSNYDKDDVGYVRRWTLPIENYADHYNYIDVLLAPLRENDFNKVKSQLKLIEAGFFHKAAIVQNFGPYTIDGVSMIEKGGKINEDGNCLLVDSSKNHKQWAKYIKWCVEHPDMVQKMADNLSETITKEYCTSKVAAKRVKEYIKLVGRENEFGDGSQYFKEEIPEQDKPKVDIIPSLE